MDHHEHSSLTPSSAGQSILLMLSAADRRRDVIVATLRTLPGQLEILCVEHYEDALRLLAAVPVTQAILDYTVEPGEQKKVIQEIRKSGRPVRIIQLVNHPRDAFINEEPRPDTILCSGFSTSDLLNAVQKNVH